MAFYMIPGRTRTSVIKNMMDVLQVGLEPKPLGSSHFIHPKIAVLMVSFNFSRKKYFNILMKNI